MRPNLLQINPLFDTELDQWLFVGELRRSIYISPVGDYDFDGIDTTEFTVSDISAFNLSLTIVQNVINLLYHKPALFNFKV